MRRSSPLWMISPPGQMVLSSVSKQVEQASKHHPSVAFSAPLLEPASRFLTSLMGCVRAWTSPTCYLVIVFCHSNNSPEKMPTVLIPFLLQSTITCCGVYKLVSPNWWIVRPFCILSGYSKSTTYPVPVACPVWDCYDCQSACHFVYVYPETKWALSSQHQVPISFLGIVRERKIPCQLDQPSGIIYSCLLFVALLK